MVTRPYTAVLIKGNSTRVVNVVAPLGKEKAALYMQEKFSTERVLALIPGEHANYSFAYDDGTIHRPESRIDLFDTGYITKNNA